MSAALSPNTVVGVVGGAASGKDTIANAFTEHGYQHVSSSDCVREEIQSRGLAAERKLQTNIANELRIAEGPGYWVEKSLEKAEASELVVISGLYAPGEGDFVINTLNGFLVGVVASLDEVEDLEIRYNRLAKRADGTRDALTFEDFIDAHERENSGILPNETNVAKLLSMAHFTVVNADGDLDVVSRICGINNSLRTLHND